MDTLPGVVGGTEEYYARVEVTLRPGRRLRISAGEIPCWETFPFESEGQLLKAVELLVDAEEARHGEGDASCLGGRT